MDDRFKVKCVGYEFRKSHKPQIIVDALDELAEVNELALQRTANLTSRIFNTLAQGLPYSPRDSLMRGATELNNSLMALIVCSEKANYKIRYRMPSPLYIEKLEEIEGNLHPHLRTLDQLFRAGYHRPSPYTGHKEINVPENIAMFNSLFTKPVQEASRILSGGGKPSCRLDKIETVQEFIRSLHDVSKARYFSLFSHILYDKKLFKITTKSVSEQMPKVFVFDEAAEGVYEQSPAWEAMRGIIDYSTIDDEWNSLDGREIDFNFGVMTPRNISLCLDFDRIGFVRANASFHHLVDATKDLHNIKLRFGNKGAYGLRTIEHTRRLMEALGVRFYHDGTSKQEFSMEASVSHQEVREFTRALFNELRRGLKQG